MKINFTTNIDKYRNLFPDNFTTPPRKGDKVAVKQKFANQLLSEGFPTSLEVVEVTWLEDRVICELWYSQQQIALLQASNKVLF